MPDVIIRLSNFDTFPRFSLNIAIRPLAAWIPAIVNHLYWSIQSCKGDSGELVERFVSCIHHVVNRHTFSGTYYTKCEHKPYTPLEAPQTDWLEPDSPAHMALKKVLLDDKRLHTDLWKLNENIYTSQLEVFHALKIRYLPKQIFFEQDKMVADMQLATLDHNLNVDRKQTHNRN